MDYEILNFVSSIEKEKKTISTIWFLCYIGTDIKTKGIKAYQKWKENFSGVNLHKDKQDI